MTDSSFQVSSTSGTRDLVAYGLYVASILSPGRVKTSPLDIWTNVKIPMIEALDGVASTDVSGTWYDIPPDNATYSALIGLPVLGVEQGVDSTFVIDTSYWTLDCPDVRQCMAGDDEDPGLFPGGMKDSAETTATDWGFMDNTPAYGPRFMSHPWEVYLMSNRNPSSDLRPRTVGYTTTPKYARGEGFLQALCYISTSYVDVQVSCSAGSCKSQKARRSAKPHLPSA